MLRGRDPFLSGDEEERTDGVMAGSEGLKISATAAVAALAATVFALIAAVEPAEAAFPGKNGKIVFDSFLPGQADSEIVTLSYNPNGGPVPEDQDPPLTDNTAQDSGAAWSPSGSKIAFEWNSEIWVMSTLSDDNAVRLTNNRGIDEYPDWQRKRVR